MTAYNRTTLKNDLLTQLGYPTLEVELPDISLDVAINKTLEVFNKYKPLIRLESYKTAPGIVFTPMPDDVTGIKDVELVFGYSQLSLAYNIESAILSGIPVFYGTADITLDIAYYDERKRWIKSLSRTIGNDPDREVFLDPVTNKWFVYTYSSGEMLVQVTTTIDHADDLSTIGSFNRNWFSRYALATSKQILSEVRGKYLAIPAAGGTVTLNGERLAKQAEIDQAKLINEIIDSSNYLYPRWS